MRDESLVILCSNPPLSYYLEHESQPADVEQASWEW